MMNVLMRTPAPDKHLRGLLKLDEPMDRHSSWRVGGTADRYYEPADLDDLVTYLQTLSADEPVLWVGLGSNLLVRDGGVRGSVVMTTPGLGRCEWTDEGLLRAEAGVPCAKVARMAAKAGYAGAEFLAGIPGTLGGALAMNAGAFGGETWELVQQVETLDRAGGRHTRAREAFETGYRHVRLPAAEWFTAATLKVQKDADGAGEARIRALLAQRAASQPTGLPSCGSVFRNPAGDYAGRLIESCGLKGLAVGGASVSDKHANFIVTCAGATAADVEALMERIVDTVRRERGVELQAEVRIVGEPAVGREA